MRIWTIGHLTLAAADFIALLQSHDIRLVADVRRFPSSRRHPQFNRESLAASLAAAGIEYRHLHELGGRREPRPDSENTGWREPGFRGYADHMQTEPFRTGVAKLLDAAGGKHLAIMCAEKAWQNCHRGLVADHLKASGIEVLHVLDHGQTELHPYTHAAHFVDGALSYAANAPAQSRLDL